MYSNATAMPKNTCPSVFGEIGTHSFEHSEKEKEIVTPSAIGAV
jgi:hypothetical protein